MNITDCVFELQKLKADNAALRERLARLVETAESVTGWNWFEVLRYAECESTEIQDDIKKLEQAISAAKENSPPAVRSRS